MASDRFRFMLGDFECLVILDDVYSGPYTSTFFPYVETADLEKAGIDPEHFSFPCNCLAVNTGAAWVVIDTGNGFMMEEAKLRQILEEEKIEPDYFILSHLDPDHFGGLIDSDNRPAFPEVPVFVCQDEWTDFMSDSFYETARRSPEMKDYLLVVAEQIQTVDCEREFLPGFSMVPLPGHTNHQVGIEIVSKSERLLFSADAVCHPLHLEHLDWRLNGDEDDAVARETRIKLARMAVDSGCLVLPAHFAFPGLGHIIEAGNGWQWQPLTVD